MLLILWGRHIEELFTKFKHKEVQRKKGKAIGFRVTVVEHWKPYNIYQGGHLSPDPYQMTIDNPGISAVLTPIYPPNTEHEPLGSPVTWVVDTPGIINLVPSDDSMSAAIAPVAVGGTDVHFQADADPDPDVVLPIQTDWHVEITLAKGKATGFDVTITQLAKK